MISLPPAQELAGRQTRRRGEYSGVQAALQRHILHPCAQRRAKVGAGGPGLGGCWVMSELSGSGRSLFGWVVSGSVMGGWCLGGQCLEGRCLGEKNIFEGDVRKAEVWKGDIWLGKVLGIWVWLTFYCRRVQSAGRAEDAPLLRDDINIFYRRSMYCL